MILIDGRVFSTDAHNRGMGRYVRFLIETIIRSNNDVGLILYKNSKLAENDPIRKSMRIIEKIDIDPSLYNADDIHICSTAIESIINNHRITAFLDATPFLMPMLFDLLACPVIAVCYDLIPLRYINEYFVNLSSVSGEVYKNGLKRVVNADFIISISNTTKDHICKYLGVERSKIEVIYPNLAPEYLQQDEKKEKTQDCFFILGSHFSKNLEFSLELFNKLDLKRKRYFICTPTQAQFQEIRNKLPSLTSKITINHSIPEKQKIHLQSSSKCIFHLSKEEGFGIPLLEGLFAYSRVICCNIKINNEILDKVRSEDHEISLTIPSNIDDVNIQQINEYINFSEQTSHFAHFQSIRNYFVNHWELEAPALFTHILSNAILNHKKFTENTIAKMVSNIPGDCCGVAEYAYQIPCGSDKNIIVYTSSTSITKLNSLRNVRIKSHLSFPNSLVRQIPTIYHYAVSQSLLCGIELMQSHGSKNDVLIIHDHNSLFGIYDAYFSKGKLGLFLSYYFVDDDAKFKSAFSNKSFIKSADFNAALRGYSYAWLKKLGIRIISHLTEEAEEEYSKFSCHCLPKQKKYLEIGISDNASHSMYRISKKWRIQKGLTDHDFLIGVFGSITNNKLLCETASAVAKLALKNCANPNSFGLTCRKIHFVICGKICDYVIFNKMKSCFDVFDLLDYLHYENPENDRLFDGTILAADAVICCRSQDRGQMSHIVPKALSLGKPIYTNLKSGFSMIRNDFVIDDHFFEEDLVIKLEHIYGNKEYASQCSQHNRTLFEQKFNIYNLFNGLQFNPLVAR